LQESELEQGSIVDLGVTKATTLTKIKMKVMNLGFGILGL
jgi:hypothetical protein